MKVLIDARVLRRDPSGVGQVIINVVKILQDVSDIEITLLTQRGVSKIEGLSRVKIIELNSGYQFVGLKRFLFEQFKLKKIIEDVDPDIVHFMDSFGIPWNLKARSIILTVHDLIPLTQYRELMSNFGFWLYKMSIAISVKKADKIVAISQFTKHDIKMFFGQEIYKKTEIIPNGVSAYEGDVPDLSELKGKYQITKPYILYMGNFSPRKNILRLIEAFANFNRASHYQLLMPGRFSDKKDIKINIGRMRDLIANKGIAEDIILIDYISEAEKDVFMKNAEFFVYPSLYEGFGLPVLEALIRKTPVLTSGNSAMEEVCGKFAYYFNPLDVSDMTKSMDMIAKDLDKIKRGSAEVALRMQKKFAWEASASKYKQLYYNQRKEDI